MNEGRSWIGRLLLALTVAVIPVGCQIPAPAIPESSSVTEPCADRLHDICCHLLLYHSLSKRLPQTLEGLPAVTGPGEVPPLICPVSGQPYLYRPEGLQLPGGPGRLVLYDAAPAHSGMRWGILIAEPKGDGPLATRVLLLPDELVRAAELQEESEAETRTQD